MLRLPDKNGDSTHTSSLASSSERSANRTADFLGSPDNSVI